MAGDADAGAADVPLSYSFTTTAKAAVDARALAHPRLVTFDIVLDGAALAVAVVLVAAGQPLLGLAIGAIAGLSLAGARWHPFQRWLIRLRSGALLGQTLTGWQLTGFAVALTALTLSQTLARPASHAQTAV